MTATIEERAAPGERVRYWDLFLLFLRAGMVFGGGTTIMGVLMRELVDRRRALTRNDFLVVYGLARIVPSASITALAVGFGWVLGRFPGSVAALAGLYLPALVPTIALVALYDAVRGSPWLDLLPVTLLPAAVALLLGAVVTLGREVVRPSPDLVIAVAALVGALVLRLNPGLVLVISAALGALFLRREGAK